MIDEIECIAQKRDKADSEQDKRICAQLLTLMDGLKPASGVVVLAATGKPNDLDPALRRFGRLDREVALEVPDEAARREMRSDTRELVMGQAARRDLEASRRETDRQVKEAQERAEASRRRLEAMRARRDRPLTTTFADDAAEPRPRCLLYTSPSPRD